MIGDDGAAALAEGIAASIHFQALSARNSGISDVGVQRLMEAANAASCVLSMCVAGGGATMATLCALHDMLELRQVRRSNNSVSR